ncbi:hypothetical protein TNCV_4599151 [Trichonephila clavipes]|nr:hypothetical protein TNCV_4599151 [Trichonephila clavipes]
MKIQTWDLNAMPFHLILVISCKVTGVSEISDSHIPPLNATGDYFHCLRACEFSYWDGAGGHKGRPALSGKISGTFKIRFWILLHHPEVHQKGTFHAPRLIRVSSCNRLRKIWLFGIIRQSYGEFRNRISHSDCPLQDKSGTKFSRSKAFKISSCHGVSKIWSSGIIRQS